MTLPLNSRLSALYDTNGTQKDFSFGFRVFFDPDNGGYGLEVRRQTADGYEVIPKSDYLVLPVEDNSAGVVRFNVAPSAGQQIYIAGKTPTIQQLVLTNFGRYSAESIETQFDFITAIIQEWLSALGEETRQRIASDDILTQYVVQRIDDFVQQVNQNWDDKLQEIEDYIATIMPSFTQTLRDEIEALAGAGMQDAIDQTLAESKAEIDDAVARANAAALAAAITGKVYDTPEAGVDPVTGVQNGAYYNVRSTEDDSFLLEYQNIGGVPAPSGKSYPSGAVVQKIADYTALPFKQGKRYALYERVQLANGDIVRSTVEGNIADPSSDLNGWDNESEKLRYSLTKTNNLLDYFTRQEKSDYIANPSTYDATAIVIRALADADILDCRKLPVGISTSVVVREGCQCLNANFFNLNVVDASILVNTSSRVTGKVTGSGAGAAAVERAVLAANDAVRDVYLDLEITNLTVGVQVSGPNALANECSGWHGVLRFKNLTGGGTNSTGYGVLLPRAKNCDFLVYADNVPRHDVYLSAGATGNTILCYSKNSKGSPLSIASYGGQEASTENTVTIHIENCTPQSSSSAFAAVVTGRSQKNNIYLYGKSSPLLEGAIVFRSLASDAVCHGNYAYINWTGGTSSALALNQSSFNNDFDIIGDGGCVNANVFLISANTYQGITTFTEGTPKYTARLRSFKWDGAKLAAGHVAYAYVVGQFTPIANFDIGEGILKGANGFSVKKVRVDLGAIVGSTHRERIAPASVSVPANSAHDFTVNYDEAYGNVSIPMASLVAPLASVANSVELAITSRTNSAVTFKAINKSTIAQTIFILGEVSGY